MRPDQRETWAKVVKTPMTALQGDLREVVARQKKKGKSADRLSDPEMKGYKRQQIERLIADRMRTDPDPRFEYKLAALKLEQGRTSRGRETTEMKAILKRQLRPGFVQSAASISNRGQVMEGEIVDLTGAEETMYSQDSVSTGMPGHFPHPLPRSPPHGLAQPLPDQAGQAFVHDPRFAPQPMYPQPGHPDGNPHQGPHGPEAYETLQQGADKIHGKDKKEKPEVHQKKDKKHKSFSDTSSDTFSDADSFQSKYTDQTPDTVYSGKSEGRYHEEKKHSSGHKNHRGYSSRRRDRSPVQRVYRERRRQSPARYSDKGSTRYEYEEYDIITSERPRYCDRVPHSMGRKNGHSYERERPSHPRALSFDDDRHHRPSYAQPRRLQSYSHTADMHAEKEELKIEIEEMRRQKHLERLERERTEREKVELRRLEMERADRIERQWEMADRAERDRLDRLHRERYERDRYERSPPRLYADQPRRYSAFDYRRDDPYYV